MADAPSAPIATKPRSNPSESAADQKPTHLLTHHKAWLGAHPNRSLDWFRALIADGFDVHHIDHDHANNAADNLALIEASDHALVHRIARAADPNHKPFDRNAYQREYMRKRRAKP